MGSGIRCHPGNPRAPTKLSHFDDIPAIQASALPFS